MMPPDILPISFPRKPAKAFRCLQSSHLMPAANRIVEAGAGAARPQPLQHRIHFYPEGDM
jgi:hypothetical protein